MTLMLQVILYRSSKADCHNPEATQATQALLVGKEIPKSASRPNWTPTLSRQYPGLCPQVRVSAIGACFCSPKNSAGSCRGTRRSVTLSRSPVPGTPARCPTSARKIRAKRLLTSSSLGSASDGRLVFNGQESSRRLRATGSRLVSAASSSIGRHEFSGPCRDTMREGRSRCLVASSPLRWECGATRRLSPI